MSRVSLSGVSRMSDTSDADHITASFLGSDPVAGTQALQELLALGDSGEATLFSRGIEFPKTVQVRRRWLRYVASRQTSIADRLVDRMAIQNQFNDSYSASYLFAGLNKDPSVIDALYKQIQVDFPDENPAPATFHDYGPASNRFVAWGFAGGDSSTLWRRVEKSSFAWEKLRTFAFRGSCAALARMNEKDCWAIEQLITHELKDGFLDEISSEPVDTLSHGAIESQELWLQANDAFAAWRRGEVADEILRSWSQHAHWRVRDFGAQILASLGFQRTVTPIVEWLQRESVQRVRVALLHALERSDTTAGADALIEHFNYQARGRAVFGEGRVARERQALCYRNIECALKR
jgi:hypothetical protein